MSLVVLLSRSRAHHAPSPQVYPPIMQRMGDIGEHPPETLRRTPGPRAILSSLHREQELQVQGQPLARSPRTIWRILRQVGYLLDAPHRSHRPQERPDPMEELQLEFKDATSVPPDPDGKQLHVGEILNCVDAGTSPWLMAEARTDFHAEGALEAVTRLFTGSGRPRGMTFDRDSRWVGSQSLRQFPSACCRFLLCLGIDPKICPKLCPDKNASVERSHRTLNQEWGPRPPSHHARRSARSDLGGSPAFQPRATTRGERLVAIAHRAQLSPPYRCFHRCQNGLTRIAG
jgi:hypothetical protein